MNKSTHYLAFALSVCCFLFSLESAANNISVSSVTLTARNKTADYVQVQFNLSWQNSFRVNTGPSNWDAAWVFIKFKVGVNGEWKHASVSTTGGHSIPSGATASQADTKGLFIYRDANGTGNLSLTGVQLRWNYGTDGVGDEEKIYVKVFAVEMVLVPQGDFQVGSGGQNTGEFRRANDVSSSSTATTFTITSSAPTFQGNNSSSSAANLSTRLGAGNDLSTGTTTATLGAGYPTGYAAFYCMKYEISQGQYRDFLNTLTYTQQVTRTASAPNSAVGTGALISSGTARNGIEIKTASTSSTTPAVYGCDLSNNNTFDEAADGEWIACNYLSWGDIAAYLDWAALRPMTELEYEKACRGNLPPVVNEYAWGVASATNVSSLLNTSQSTEASNTSGANLVSNSAFSTGPVKVGIFATGSSTRIQAGSGYYGIMELSGNVWEQTVPISTANARSFSNVMGDGTLATDGNAVVTTWPVSSDVGIRGGSYTSAGALNYVSDRTSISAGVTARNNNVGGRGVRATPTIILSTNGNAEVSSYTCSTASAGTMTAGTPVSGVTQTITANVTTVGTYGITAVANGVTFFATGTFAGIGAQNIVLTATGTPTAAGSHSFTLNTTPNCSFTRTTLAPLPTNITLSSITPYFVASVYDQDYLPYTAPTVVASLATAQAANGVNEATSLNIQGSLTTTGVTLKIPYTVVTATVSLPAFSQTINVPASYTEDGIARDVTFSYGAATLAVGSGTIDATLQAVGGTLNAKKLDIQTGIGNDGLGWLLAQFTYATNNSGGSANFAFRDFAAIPDRNYDDAAHRMLYLPVLGADGRIWLNNNLGADYANTTNGSFNPSAQASSSTDANAYGSLFQWGRGADGHEFRTSGNITGPISSPWTSANFIGANGTAPNDWRTPQDDNLWQGESGTNNPCPIGYRLPTETEQNIQRLSWSANNSAGAFGSPLKLTLSGLRHFLNGSINNVGSLAYYLNSTVAGINASQLYFDGSNSFTLATTRAAGRPVRCIAAGHPSTNGTAVVSGYSCSTASAGTMTAGVAVSGVTQTITANVTTVGTYIISTLANGVVFTASGIFTGTGAQNIVLTAIGTPTYGTANAFTLNTTPNCSFNRTTTGDASSNGSAVVSAYTCNTASAGTMTAGVAVSGVTQTITASVTTAGTYSISTMANGVTFARSGTFAGTGAQNIVLIATGTPTAAGSNSFTLNTTPNCSFSRTTLVNPSSNGTAVVSSYTCSTASAGTMTAGVAVSGVTQTITANVTTAGTYSISTTANGVTFAGSGTFAGTGAQDIVLTANGTPTAAGSNTFTLNTTPNCSFSRSVD
jgi:formylglycine-generating enzyme required for sulfatase activity